MEHFAVIIIGGGPAGATLSHFLKECGVDSLIIEKGMPFKDKICAGGLPIGIEKIMPSTIKNFKRNDYTKFSVDYKGNHSLSLNPRNTFLYGVMRTKFDQFLREGINIHYSERFIKYEDVNNNIIVYTDKSKYLCKFFIGADGVGSFVSIQSGLAKDKKFIIAEEKEVQGEPEDKNNLSIFLGYNFLGYGWTLPKEGFTSSGSGALKGHFKKGTVNKFNKGIAPLKVFPISIWNKTEPLTQGRVALVGEAGNLVDPFTAAGIYTSILSSMLLSEVIDKNLKSGATNLAQYNKLLEDKLYNEFRYARILSNLFYPFLPLINKIILREEFVNYLLELAQDGYISYEQVFKRVENTRRIHIKIAYALLKIFTH